MKLTTKKTRVKTGPIENGIHNDLKEKQEKKGISRRKNKDKKEDTTTIDEHVIKRAKKEKTEDEFLAKQDDKDLLSLMNIANLAEPRLKRKCVLQNESKTRDWWSDEEEEEEEEDDDDDDDDDEEEEDGAERSNKEEDTTIKVENNGNEEDHLEKDDKEQDDVKLDPKAKRRRKSRQAKTVQKQEKIDETTPVVSQVNQGNNIGTEVRCYVFSTGMANRAGYAVTKGTHKSISAYHHSQMWDTPYLNPEIHCRPFFPQLENVENKKDLSDAFDEPMKDIAVKQNVEDNKKEREIKVELKVAPPAPPPQPEPVVERKPPVTLVEKSPKPSPKSSPKPSPKPNILPEQNITIDHTKDEVVTKSEIISNVAPDENVKSPLHPRFHLMGKKEITIDTKDLLVNNNESESNIEVKVEKIAPVNIVEPLHIDTKLDPKLDPKIDPKIEPKINPKNEPKIEPKIEPKLESKIETKIDTKIDTKFDTKFDANINAMINTKMNTKIDTKVETKIDTKVEESIVKQIESVVSSKSIIENKIPVTKVPVTKVPVTKIPITRVPVTKLNTYPADITRISKNQLCFKQEGDGRYEPPILLQQRAMENKVVQQHHSPNNSRPSVLNMVSDRKIDQSLVRSSIDIAEKELKEIRTSQLQPSSLVPPVISLKSTSGHMTSRDMHPSIFMSKLSPRMHISAFSAPQQAMIPPHPKSLLHHNGHGIHPPGPVVSNNSIFSSKRQQTLNGPFTPPPPSSISKSDSYPTPPSSYHTEHHIPKYTPSNPVPHGFQRHKSNSPPHGYQNIEMKYNERFNPLSSTMRSTHERPSSLPVPSTHRIGSPKIVGVNPKGNKSFSVESLTKSSSDNRPEKFDSLHHAIENFHRRLPPSRTLNETSVLPEHFVDRIPPNLRGSNGIDIHHNGLKRSLDERLSNDIRTSDIRIHDKNFLGKLEERRFLEHERYREHLIEKDRFLIDKERERFLSEKERYPMEKERILALEKERFYDNERSFIPRSRLPFPPQPLPTDSRSAALLMQQSFMASGGGGKDSQNPSLPSPAAYSMLHRMGLHPFPATPYSKR